MSLSVNQPRPPFVEFKQVAVEDRNASIAAGRRVTKNVNMALIMQPGSRDQLEIIAEDWLETLKRSLYDGSPNAYPEEWVAQFRTKFESWKQGIEAPVSGTHVREWAAIGPAEVENLLSLKIFTVEDVGAMTEEAMAKYGMGGRALRDKARDWLSAQSVAQDVAKENNDLKKQLEELTARIAELEASPKRGRPPKIEA